MGAHSGHSKDFFWVVTRSWVPRGSTTRRSDAVSRVAQPGRKAQHSDNRKKCLMLMAQPVRGGDGGRTVVFLKSIGPARRGVACKVRERVAEARRGRTACSTKASSANYGANLKSEGRGIGSSLVT